MKAFKTKFGTALLYELMQGLVEHGQLDEKHPYDYDFYFIEDGEEYVKLIMIDNFKFKNGGHRYTKSVVLNFNDTLGGQWGELPKGEWIEL